MTTMRLVRWGEARAMPWKNGGGVTHEVAIHPDGAGLDDFDWRISMAEVAADGAFSSFEGITRTLCLLDGAGIRLSFDGGATEVIDADAQPFEFSGADAVTGSLIAGPILDLNVMVRQGAADLRVVRVTVAGQAGVEPGCVAVACRDGALRVAETGIALGPRDCLLLRPGQDRLVLEGRGTAFVVRAD